METITHIQVQRPPLFAPEKMSAKIDLPRSMQVWESHKMQMMHYKEQRGGTVPHILRLSSRIGMPILLAFSGLIHTEDLRRYAMLVETRALIEECVAATGMSADDAEMLWKLRGLQRGAACGWRDVTSEI